MIEKYSFGKINIAGVTYHSDVKIINGMVLSGWRRKKGHRVDVDDLKDMLDVRPQILVVGKGKFGLMTIAPTLRQFLEKSGITLVEKNTAEAVAEFNRLYRAGQNVCAGFHLTC